MEIGICGLGSNLIFVNDKKCSVVKGSLCKSSLCMQCVFMSIWQRSKVLCGYCWWFQYSSSEWVLLTCGHVVCGRWCWHCCDRQDSQQLV